MKRTNILTSCILVILLALLTMGSGTCNQEEPQDRADRLAVSAQQEQYRQNQPVRRYNFSNELDIYQQIYDIRVEGSTNTWTVIRSNTGKILDHFATLGFPLPYDVQLTNPLKVVDLEQAGVAIEQPEPNGLYSSKNTAATWVLITRMVNDRVVVTPFYTEDRVSCYTYPIDVDYVNNRVTPVPDTMPSIEINIKSEEEKAAIKVQ